jgi:dissimilatory sulfite reductase related protein
MVLKLEGRDIPVDEEGFLINPNDWTEDIAEVIARNDGYQLKDDHKGFVKYFRRYWNKNATHPTMQVVVKEIGGSIGKTSYDRKILTDHLNMIFPRGPVSQLCKLAGLPRPYRG